MDLLGVKGKFWGACIGILYIVEGLILFFLFSSQH